MSDKEVQNAMEIKSLKEDVGEIKTNVKELQTTTKQIEVFLAGQYVTRKEYEKHIEKENTARWRWGGAILTICGLVIAAANLIK